MSEPKDIEYTIPDECPTESLPSDLAGFQSVCHGRCVRGDLLVDTRDFPRCFEWAWKMVGKPISVDGTVGDGSYRVYRKIPVAKQGDTDTTGWKQVSASGLRVTDKPVRLLVEGTPKHYIPQDSDERKQGPMFRGLLGYFPAALFEVARHSLLSDKKHNPGATDAPYWARGKSADHPDCIVRHLIDAGDINTPDRLEHLRSLAWRSLAMLQEECERLGSKPGVRSKFPTTT